MKKAFFQFAIIPTIMLLFAGCCNCEKDGNSSTVNKTTENQVQQGFLKIDKTEAWIDMMPGGPNGFLFTGEAMFAAWERPEADSIICVNATIFSEEKEIAKFPFLILPDENKFQKPGKTSFINFRFSNKERNSTKGLTDLKAIDIKLEISYKGEIYIGKIEGVEVKRTY